jgi:hypothetical protein
MAMASRIKSLAPAGGGNVRGPMSQAVSWALLSVDDFWFDIILSFLVLVKFG